jgi:3-oxoacyl-[acyl-carrier protein] reductase
MEESLKNKTIVISGASSGIGYQISQDLLQMGARIIMLGRNKEKLINSKKELIQITKNDKIIDFQADITKNTDINKLSDVLNDEKIYVYGLVNNAGINPSRENLLNTTNECWEETINTNIKGAFYLTKIIIKSMLKNKSGSVVNISSIAGISGMRDRFAYLVSKTALIGFTKSIAVDYGKQNIRSNCICPGYIKTPLTQNYLASLSQSSYDKLNQQHFLKGIGGTKDVSNLVSFLLSERSNWITGTVIPIDGGYTLGANL